jgi:N-acetylornithine carbamoyltransferase
MQTFLHGRDLIGDLDFSKEEVETVLDLAFDLKRKRAIKELTPYLRDRCWRCYSSSAARERGVLSRQAWRI